MLWVAAAPTNDPGASCRKTKLKENEIRFQFWLVFRAYFVVPPSRRLSGGRLARNCRQDAGAIFARPEIQDSYNKKNPPHPRGGFSLRSRFSVPIRTGSVCAESLQPNQSSRCPTSSGCPVREPKGWCHHWTRLRFRRRSP